MQDKITAYIEQQEPWKQTVLKRVRGVVHDADPHMGEVIKWGAPAFDHKGLVVWMFCAREWVNVTFPQGALLDDSHGLWDGGPDVATKASRTMKIREGDSIPAELLTHLIHEAVSNNLEGRRVELHVTKPGSKEFDVPEMYKEILEDRGVLELYENRPYYQQKGWIQWIDEAKRLETRQKRVNEMVRELDEGTYMPSKKMERE
jgi:hypothetical protein